MATATALSSRWPDSSICLAGIDIVIVSSSAAEPAVGRVVLLISSATSGVGVVFNISTCLGHSCSLTPYTDSKHSPATPGFLRVAQVLSTVHPLHLELGTIFLFCAALVCLHAVHLNFNCTVYLLIPQFLTLQYIPQTIYRS